MTIEEIMNLAKQMIDPRNTQAPILGGIRQFNQQTFGTPWYLDPNLSSEEKMMNMAMSFGPASIGKVKPAVEIVANPIMKKALEMSRKIGTERIPTIDETSDIIKMAREQLKLPKNVFNRMSPRELLDELTSLATKNQKYAYQELPQISQGVRKYKNVELFYGRNPAKASKVNEMGQEIEPSGKYLNINVTPETALKGWETGKIKFSNPLIIKWENWKQNLTQRYGGLTGKDLSKAIVKDGYDGIITIDKGKPSEAVSLKGVYGR